MRCWACPAGLRTMKSKKHTENSAGRITRMPISIIRIKQKQKKNSNRCSRRTNRSWMNASTAPRTRAEVRRMAEMLTAGASLMPSPTMATGPFGGFDPFGGAYGNGGSARNDYGNSEQEMRLQAAANYINSGHFREAMNVLNDISDRSGKWYFLHAIANSRLGNNINAVQDAEMAVKLEPQNLQYQQLLNQLQGSGQWYSDMGSGYGYERSAGDLGKWCCECMAINAICNCCCCGGRGFFCC